MKNKKHLWALAFLVLAQFMIVLDVSIVNVALPSIQKTFGLSVSNLQAMVTAYTLAFGGFLLLGGRTADLYGRRRTFIAGVSGFIATSFLVGFAPSSAFLAPLRAVQGLSAAFMSPSALSIVLTMFREANERARALSIWGAVSAGGATAGLLLGGILTEFLGWRWNFFVNVPIGILIIIAVLRLVPKHESEERNKTLDIVGALLATGGPMLFVFSLSKINSWGFTVPTIALIIISLLFLPLFIWRESKTKHPLVPLSIFKVGNVAAADLVMLPVAASLFSMFFFISIYIQDILHFTPLNSGLAFLPTSVTIAVCAIAAPKFIRRVGFKTILTIAPLLIATSLFAFAHISVQQSYASLVPWLILIGAGLGFCFVSITISATSGVPPQESGLASGLVTTAQQMGGSIGRAVLTAISASETASLVHNNPAIDRALASVQGFHSAFYAGMAFAILASALAYTRLKKIPGAAMPAGRVVLD
jgi:EmrB/QacA subfamily drug resistance transporter